jgi:hypothetical protein
MSLDNCGVFMTLNTKGIIGIQDAMDNLASIMSINLDSPPPVGVIKKYKIVTEEEELSQGSVQWLSSEGSGVLLEVLDVTYQAIHLHLQSLHLNAQMDLSHEKTLKGITSMMTLVGESAAKMDAYLKFRLGASYDSKVADRESFKELQKFYKKHFAPKIAQDEDELPSFDTTNSGLNDLHVVKKDAEYELFYIRNEEGKPYFSEELLRNIKLSCDFELACDPLEEDPLLKIRAVEDRDLQATAKQILGDCYPLATDFYKIYLKVEENELAESLSMCFLALFMAGNSAHLIQNTSGKSCQQYFADFQRFLRRAMKTSEYQRLVAYPPDSSDRISHLLLYLTHSLARSLFERVGGVRQETIALVHRTMRRGEEIKQQDHEHLAKGETLWNQFLIDDDKYRTFLAKFPNGPIFKTLDVIRESEEEDAMIPFDPIVQGNLPSKLYEVEIQGRRIHILRVASPTRQTLINKVEVIDEFKAFLRSLVQDGGHRKHLLINLQDRTSWKEFARVKCLETLQTNAEYGHQFASLTLPKDTDFYYQNNDYLNMNKSVDFLNAFKAQLESPEQCGFYFPVAVKPSEILRFAENAFPLIHELFFHGKNSLTRRNREDFIEIFYQLLILKCIELLDPYSISFTCKDAIDVGAAQNGIFYGLIKMIEGTLTKRECSDFLRYLFYAPALFIRERAIDSERFNRALSALERVDGELQEGKGLEKLASLYSPSFWKNIKASL